jgi:cobalamin synthase
MPSIGKAIIPVSWEGYAVTVAFVLGFVGLIKFVANPIRGPIALTLWVAAYGAIVFLTWEDPDADGRRGWRETLFNRQTLVWLAGLLVLAAAFAAAGYDQRLHPRPPAPWLHPLKPQVR